MKDATTSQTEQLISLSTIAAEKRMSHNAAYNALLAGRFGEPIRVGRQWYVRAQDKVGK